MSLWLELVSQSTSTGAPGEGGGVLGWLKEHVDFSGVEGSAVVSISLQTLIDETVKRILAMNVGKYNGIYEAMFKSEIDSMLLNEDNMHKMIRIYPEVDSSSKRARHATRTWEEMWAAAGDVDDDAAEFNLLKLTTSEAEMLHRVKPMEDNTMDLMSVKCEHVPVGTDQVVGRITYVYLEREETTVFDTEINTELAYQMKVKHLLGNDVMREKTLPYLSPFDAAFYVGPRLSVTGDQIPRAHGIVIKDYQTEAILTAINKHRGRSLITLAPGLGKTLIGCLFADYYESIREKMYKSESRKFKPKILVICPASKKKDWQEEYKRWTGRTHELTTESFTGAATDLHPGGDGKLPGPGVCRKTNWRVIIVDECHKLKNATRARAKAIVPFLCRNQDTTKIIMLSGTPQPNRTNELYNLLSILNPKEFNFELESRRREFEARYCGGAVDRDGDWVAKGISNGEELKALVRVYNYRNDAAQATKAKLLRHKVTIGATEDQNDQCEKDMMYCLKLKNIINHSKNPEARRAAKRSLERKTLKMAIWSGTQKGSFADVDAIINHMFAREIDPTNPNAVIKVSKREKLVIFCHHVGNVALNVMKRLKSDAFGYTPDQLVLITGATKLKDRQTRVAKLADPNSEALIGVLTVGAVGEGITLTPGCCNMIIMEIEHTPAAMLQAEKRIHRLNSVTDANVYWLFLENAIDERMLQKLDGKLDQNATSVGGVSSITFDSADITIEAPPEEEAGNPFLDDEAMEADAEEMEAATDELNAEIAEDLQSIKEEEASQSIIETASQETLNMHEEFNASDISDPPAPDTTAVAAATAAKLNLSQKDLEEYWEDFDDDAGFN